MMLSLLQLSAAGSPPRALSPLVAGTKRRRLLAEMGDELETAHSMLDPADVASFPVGPSGATELGLRWPWQLPPSLIFDTYVAANGLPSNARCMNACSKARRAVLLWPAALCAPHMGKEGPWAAHGIVDRLAATGQNSGCK